MVTSNYMPDVEVHIAFDSGYTTPAASRTWVDVSEYVELADRIAIAFGRQDERSTAGANTLNLTLDNSDGRFTAGLQHLVNRVQDPSMRGWGTWSPLGSPGYTIGNYGNAPGETNGQALRVTASGVYREVREPAFNVTPGDTYRVRAYGWVESTATGAGTNLAGVFFYDASGTFVSAIGPTWSQTDAGAGWIQREATGVVPVNAVTARPVVRITSGLLTGAFLIDAVQIQQVSPYYPNVKIGRPIRVRATPPGGTTSTRFVGFVDEWPVEWDGTDAYAKARIRASSRLARLGLSARMRSAPEHEIDSANPARYWTLGDPSGSTRAAESAGGRPLEVSSDLAPLPVPVFGNATGPGVDGLTAAEFFYTSSGGGILRGDSGFTTAARTLRCWALVSALPVGFDATIFAVGSGFRLRITPAGVVAGNFTTGPSINDGAGHELVLTHDGTTERLYVDGTLVSSAAGAAPSGSAVYVGGFSGSMAHVGIYDSALSAGVIASQASAVLTGFAGDRTDERVVRLLGWAGVPSTEVTAQAGAETMTYQRTGGQSVTDALRDCESTEGGVLFDGRDGNVTFHNRSNRYQATVAATLDMAEQQVEAGYAPKLDRSALVNDATAENPTTGETARTVDTTSSDEYGPATASTRVVADTYDPLQQAASWLVASYAEPRVRVPSLTVDVLAQQGDVNWLENPSFETNTNDWFASNGTLSRVVTTTPQGTTTMTYTSTAAVAGGNVAYTGPVPAAPGEVWTASCWLRMITTATDYRIYARFYDSGGSTITQAITVVPAANLSLTDYTRISVTGTAPDGTASVRLMVLPSAGLTIGHGFRVDGAMLTRGDVLLDYFDGSTAGCEWSGTAHASTSFNSSPSAQTLLGITVGDLLAVTNAPAQNDTTDPSYFVEGYNEVIGPQSYEISFNVSPTNLMLDTVVLDDATRGVLDAGNIIAL